MSLIVTISGSPSPGSRTGQLTEQIGATLLAEGFKVRGINVRDLPPQDLIYGVGESPAVQAALQLVAQADGIVVSTPIYKASYTGVLKSFLDLLPQFGLAGKVVLPVATGGTLAHVLAIDYGLRPVLLALAAQHVVSGLFILDKLIERQAGGDVRLESEIQARLDLVVADFALSLRRLQPAVAVAGTARVDALVPSNARRTVGSTVLPRP
jgi:FMN reductase